MDGVPVLSSSAPSTTPNCDGDADRLDALLADDFLSIGEQGYQLGKREWIGRYLEFRLPVRRDHRKGGGGGGGGGFWEMALAVRLSHVWIQEPGGWQLVAIQFSTLRLWLNHRLNPHPD